MSETEIVAPVASGRSRKLDEALIERIAESVSHGVTYEVASGANGVGLSTMMLWMSRGRDMQAYHQAIDAGNTDVEYPAPSSDRATTNPELDRLCLQLLERVLCAREEAEKAAIEAVHQIGTRGIRVPCEWDAENKPIAWTFVAPDWRAAAWYAERNNPKKWGRRQAIEVSGPDGGPIQVASPVERVRGEIGAMRQKLGLEQGDIIDADVVEDE